MKVLTPQEVKERLLARGMTVSQWARDNGYTPLYVSKVLNGQLKGNYGKAHECAVKLGIKADPAKAA